VARITEEERSEFRACRRRWDFGSPNRQNLEPRSRRPGGDIERAIKDALAVYYFPGMWDWPRPVVLPLVAKGFQRSADAQRAERPLDGDEAERWRRDQEDGQALLDAYTSWAPTADHFAPVLVEADFEAQIPDPDIPTIALSTAGGDGLTYAGRAEALVIDEYDAYWIVRHRLVERWSPIEQLLLDGGTSTSCWAWANFYLGMTITGTIDNELLLRPTPEQSAPDPSAPVPPAPDPSAPDPPAPAPARRVGQSDGSGGGRSIPQHRRLSARAMEPAGASRVEVQQGPGVRRTWIRRGPQEIAAAGAQLAREARMMADPATPAYPSPSIELCPRCDFRRPCLEMHEGRDPSGTLTAGFRAKPAELPVEGRIGSATWSVGRGAAPPTFGGSRRGPDPPGEPAG
jgi:hypothetical protein